MARHLFTVVIVLFSFLFACTSHSDELLETFKEL